MRRSLFAPAGRTLHTLLFAFVIGTLNNFYQAYSTYYSISAAKNLQNFLNVSYASRGVELSERKLLWIWSFNLNALTLGNIFGTLFTYWLCEHFGRKMILLLSNGGIFVATFFSTLAIVFLLPELFLISRICGAILSTVNFCAFALFATEFPSTKLRGLVIFVSGVCFIFAANIGMLFGMDLFLGKNLEILVGFGLVPSFFAILTSLALEETPKFLLLNRKDKERALKSLEFYQGDSVDHKKALVEIMKERQQNDEQRRPMLQMLRELFTQRHLRLSLLLGICSLQLTVGTWPVTTTLFADHFPLKEAQLFSFLCSGLSLVANVPGTLMSSRVSRRKMLLYPGLVNALCIVFYAIFDRLTFVHADFRYGCLVSNLVYFCTFGVSLGIIPYYICGELFPQSFRAIGQSVVFFVSCCSIFLFNIFTLPAYSAFGVFIFFPLFTAPQFLCLAFLWIYLPETNGREVHEIVEELKRGNRQRKVRDCSDRRTEGTKPAQTKGTELEIS